MPAYPSHEELEYVTSQLAAVALERAADAGNALHEVTHAWFPDHDQIDKRKIARDVSTGLSKMRALVLQRCDKLVAEGKARCPGGQIQHHS